MKNTVKLTTETYNKISQLYASKFDKPSDHIEYFLKLIKIGGNILDAGCGAGVDSCYMQSKGYLVNGIDMSINMIELAKKKNPKVHFEKADMRELNFGTETFDGILSSFSIIHIPKQDLLSTLNNFNRILKREGVIYLGIQEGDSKEIVIDEPLKLDEKIFLNIMSVQELKNLLEAAGFEILKEFNRLPKNKEELSFNKLVVIGRKTNMLK